MKLLAIALLIGLPLMANWQGDAWQARDRAVREATRTRMEARREADRVRTQMRRDLRNVRQEMLGVRTQLHGEIHRATLEM